MVVYLSVPFMVGDQPGGAESLNPVKALETMTTQGDSTKQLLMVALYLGIVAAMLRWTRFNMSLFLGAPLLLLIAWCVVSTLWSIDAHVTIRRSAALVGTVMLGTYMGIRFDMRTMLRLMSYVTAIVLLGSIVVAVALPSAGLDFEGRLRGVTAHKNGISGYASIAFLMLVAQLIDMNYRSRLAAIGDGLLVCLCVVCMVWSESAAALPVLVLALPSLPITRILRTADKSVVALIPMMIGVAVGILALAVYFSDSIAGMLGKDSDMSGRTRVWAYAIKMIFEHPWLGYGYSTFWEGFSSPGGVFWSLSGLGIPHSHNGYIQLALDTGIVGVVLFLTALISVVFKLAWLIRYGNDSLVGWAVAFLGMFLVGNLAETRLWIGNELDTVLFVYVTTYANFSVWKTLNGNRQLAYTAEMQDASHG
jgi:O-antigen ligase